MAANITDDEWDELSPDNFDTMALLSAVDAVDELRSDLNDNEDGAPPQLRDDLLKLHQLAIAVILKGESLRKQTTTPIENTQNQRSTSTTS